MKVDPAADVEVVQASMASLLSSTFPHSLTADPDTISVLPVGAYGTVRSSRPSQTLTKHCLYGHCLDNGCMFMSHEVDCFCRSIFTLIIVGHLFSSFSFFYTVKANFGLSWKCVNTLPVIVV